MRCLKDRERGEGEGGVEQSGKWIVVLLSAPCPSGERFMRTCIALSVFTWGPILGDYPLQGFGSGSAIVGRRGMGRRQER